MRKVCAGLGHMRQERVGQEDDLLFGLPRIHRVNDEQVRRQFAGLGFARFADGDARIDTGERVVQAGRGLDHLPAVGTVEPRVGGQQSLQQRGAAAHHPDNDDRCRDALVRESPGVRRIHSWARSRIRRLCTMPDAQDVHPDDVQVGGSRSQPAAHPTDVRNPLAPSRSVTPCAAHRRSTAAKSKGPTRSELQVLADVADLVDEHDATVEPPHAVQPMKRVFVVPGHDHLQRQVAAWPG